MVAPGLRLGGFDLRVGVVQVLVATLNGTTVVSRRPVPERDSNHTGAPLVWRLDETVSTTVEERLWIGEATRRTTDA